MWRLIETFVNYGIRREQRRVPVQRIPFGEILPTSHEIADSAANESASNSALNLMARFFLRRSCAPKLTPNVGLHCSY